MCSNSGRWMWLAAAILLPMMTAQAVVVTPGNTVAISGTSVGLRPELGGPIIVDDTVAYSIPGFASGTIQRRVVRDIGGTLDFYWQVTRDANSTVDIGSLRVRGFESVTTDVDFRTDGLGTLGPSSVHSFSPNLGYLNFNFNPALSPATTSRFMFIHTDATTYHLESDALDVATPEQNPISNSLPTYVPGVPEPATMSLLALGGLAVLRRKRK
ncbi:MAG: PEP-CTERM sorting domain-containing protein [Planctomycetota bacterium]|nr:PEP-CTERM sorting domain-containing protein [Planctomycetota bacterium]